MDEETPYGSSLGPFEESALSVSNGLVEAGITIGVSSTVISGSVASSTGDATLEVDYTVPEPAPMALGGVGLVALGVFGGRRRKA